MISAVVNTWNEENYIRNCLSCLKWCDEIIVVDMHSKDKTRDIAVEFTDKIFLHEYTRYVEPARKFGVDKAEGEWIFILDADEMITPELADILRKSSQDEKIDMLSIPRKNFMFGRWIKTAGWWPGYQNRFFRKDKGEFSDKIHTMPQPLGRIHRLPAQEKCAILHFNYVDSTDFVERLNRYTSIEAGYLIKSGENTSLWKVSREMTKEFLVRFVRHRGILSGWDGMFLTAAMIFYRFVTHYKCRELTLKSRKGIDPGKIYANESRLVSDRWNAYRIG